MTYYDLRRAVQMLAKECENEKHLSFVGIVSDDTSVDVMVKDFEDSSVMDNLLATLAACYVNYHKHKEGFVSKRRFLRSCVKRLKSHIREIEKSEGEK